MQAGESKLVPRILDCIGGQRGHRIFLPQVWMDAPFILLENVIVYCSPSVFSYYYLQFAIQHSQWLRQHGLFPLLSRQLLYRMTLYATWLRQWGTQFLPEPPDIPEYIRDYYCYPLLVWDWRWTVLAIGMVMAFVVSIGVWTWMIR